MGEVAKAVEEEAFSIEHGLRPNGGETQHSPTERIDIEKLAEDAEKDVEEQLDELSKEAPERVKERLLSRIEEVRDLTSFGNNSD